MPSENAEGRGLGDDVMESFDGSIEKLTKATEPAKLIFKRKAVLGAIIKYLVQKSAE